MSYPKSEDLTERQQIAVLNTLTLDQQVQIIDLVDQLSIVKKALEYTQKGFNHELLHPNDYACLLYLLEHKTFKEEEF